MQQEYKVYRTEEKMAPEIIAEKRKIYNGVSANVDFYSGMVYRMLGLPSELYTPLFAIARIAGWCAHRIEEIQNAGKIIRPAYINVKDAVKYIPIDER
jgi:citrate synthase